MERLQWMTLWDRFREEVEKGQTSYGKNQIIALMERLEREEVRRVEIDNQFEKEDQ